ncbi:MAG TPA: PD-(D/E)XK nuclease family protein [Oscillospiraceae bacterium]|nr:PD-(D/E)XK nuclease family protein [Oscillospiraceae bacterium]
MTKYINFEEGIQFVHFLELRIPGSLVFEEGGFVLLKKTKIDVYFAEQASVLRDKLFAEMISHSGDWPDNRAFLLVPERQKADLERAYLEEPGADGLMMSEVLSFSRLAQRIFSEAGGAEAGTLSRPGKAMLIQRLLIKNEGIFRRFQSLAERPAFAAEMAEVMGDFYRYDISAEDLRSAALAEESSVREITQDKLADFASLKDLLEGAFDQMGLVDRDSNLDRACRVIEDPVKYPRLDFLATTDIFIYGFGSERLLTVQEQRVLEALSGRVRAMTFFVLADEPASRALPFDIGRRSLLELKKTYPEADFRRLTCPEAKTAQIKVVLADSLNDEVNYLAGEIRELLFSKKYRRRDIAVGLCETDITTLELDAAFNEYGIASYIDSGRKLTQSSCLRALAQILKLSVDNFSFADAMQYLRCGLTGLSESQIDAFENVCLSSGINNAGGLKRFCEKEDRQLSYYEELSDDREISEGVRKVCGHLCEIFAFGASMRQVRTARAKLDYLRENLLGNRTSIFNGDTFQARVEAEKQILLQSNHEQEALNLVAAWNALVDLSAEAGLVLQDERMSQKHFAQMFMAGLEGLSQSSIPVGIDRVRVGSVAQIVDYPAKVLYIVGADADHFPISGPGEGFLRDDERAWLSQHTGAGLPHRLDNLAVTQALINYRLESQPESLRISAATKSKDKHSLQLQSWISAENTETVLLETDTKPDARWNIFKYARRGLMFSREKYSHSLWRNAIRAIEKRGEIPQTGDSLTSNFILEPGKFILTDRSYRILQPGSISISALQRYNACPFQYFVDYGLNLRERDIAEDNPREQGSFVHRLLELALLDLQGRLQAVPPADRSRVVKEWHQQIAGGYLRDYYAQILEEPGFYVYGRPEVSGMIGERLLQHAAATLLLTTAEPSGDTVPFYPHALEWQFPQTDDPNPYVLDVDGQAVVLRGLIDRVDVDAGAEKYRLYDFKRSERSNKKSQVGLVDGTDIQLPIYRKVWQHANPQMQVDASLLLFFKNRAESNKNRLSHLYLAEDEYLRNLTGKIEGQKPEELEKDSDFAIAIAKESIRSIRQGYFPATPVQRSDNDGGSPCGYCDYRGLCYYDAPQRPAPPPTISAGELEKQKQERWLKAEQTAD